MTSLIFVTTHKNAKKKDVSGYAKKNGVTEFAVPKTIIEIDKMPVLGSGKTDYTAVQKFVEGKLVKAA